MKASKDSEKEKKIYEQRIISIKNRIAALQKQEEEINRKKNKAKLQEKNMAKAQEDKKKIMESIKEVKNNEEEDLKKKKERIKNENYKIKTGIQNAMILNKKKKQNEYNEALNEKKNIYKKIDENHIKLEEENLNKIKVIRADRKRMKEEEQKKIIKEEENLKERYYNINKSNKKETDKLKEELEKLEKMEEQCFQNLNNTKNQDLFNPKKLNYEKSSKLYRSKSTISERNGKDKITYNKNINSSQKKIKIISKGNKSHKDSV